MALYNASEKVYLDLKINDKELVTDWTNLVYFKITEYSGLALTYFDCCFRTFNKEIADLVVTNNKVIATVGEDPNFTDTFEINIAKENKDNGGVSNQYMVTFSGVIGNPQYLIDTKSEFYVGTSLEVIKQFYNTYLRNKITNDIISDITVNDLQETPMTWFRTNQAGNMFLADVWLHMNVYPSFPLLSIDKYNNLIIKDYYKLQQSTPKWNFVGANQFSHYQPNDILFLNNFNVKSYKETSNMFSGYGKFVTISNSDTGKYGIFNSDTSNSLLSNSQSTEWNNYGTRIMGATVNSGNVYNGYQQAYFYNTSKLVDLSSYEGMLQLSGNYYKELAPLDLVNITSGTVFTTIEGKYIIDTIETIIMPNQAIQTKVYVCRDNLNELENSLNIAEIRNRLVISANTKGRLLQTLKDLRTIVSFARDVISGQFLDSVISYIKEVKYTLLSSFNINGVTLNLNSKWEALNSLLRLANSLANDMIDGIIPPPYNMMFHDILMKNKPSSIKSVLSAFVQYLPADIQDIVSQTFSLLAESSYLLQDIRDKNKSKVQQQNIATNMYTKGKSVKITETPEGITDISIIEDKTDMNNEERVQQQIDTTVDRIESKTQLVDIPIPVIDLTDSQKLMNNEKINELVVDTVIENLEERGYLIGIDPQVIKNIFMNPSEYVTLDSETINKMRINVGNTMYTRFWGTFDTLNDLTNFYIENSFKDIYRTISMTKLVNATGGKRLFVAIPSSQVNKRLRFYINNVNVSNQIGVGVDTEEHPLMELTLNVTDTKGNNMNYTVFYTDTLYNSNSVILEMRQV